MFKDRQRPVKVPPPVNHVRLQPGASFHSEWRQGQPAHCQPTAGQEVPVPEVPMFPPRDPTRRQQGHDRPQPCAGAGGEAVETGGLVAGHAGHQPIDAREAQDRQGAGNPSPRIAL